MQALPGTLHAVTKQRPNCTPHNRMQMMRIDEVRVPNTNKGLQKRARPSSMASNTQKAISSRYPSIQDQRWRRKGTRPGRQRGRGRRITSALGEDSQP
jgi:hypothetical protein